MANENRFSGLVSELNQGDKGKSAPQSEDSNKPEPKPKAKSKKPLPKSKDPNYSQIGIYLPTEIHKQMKIGAAMTGLEMSEIAAKGIEMWLKENVPNS